MASYAWASCWLSTVGVERSLRHSCVDLGPLHFLHKIQFVMSYIFDKCVECGNQLELNVGLGSED